MPVDIPKSVKTLVGFFSSKREVGMPLTLPTTKKAKGNTLSKFLPFVETSV